MDNLKTILPPINWYQGRDKWRSKKNICWVNLDKTLNKFPRVSERFVDNRSCTGLSTWNIEQNLFILLGISTKMTTRTLNGSWPRYEIRRCATYLPLNNFLIWNFYIYPSMRRFAIVSWSSSGIGFETSLMLARQGFTTYATMRDLQKSSTLRSIADKEKIPLRCVQLDVTNDMSVKQVIETIVNESHKMALLN